MLPRDVKNLECKGIKYVQINIRSVTKHIDQLRWIISNISPDVLSVNETRL